MGLSSNAKYGIRRQSHYNHRLIMPEDQSKLFADILTKLAEHEIILKKLEKYIFWQQVWGWVKMVLIVAPLVVSWFILQPLLKQLTAQFLPLLSPAGAGINANGTGLPQGTSPLDALKQYQELLKGGQ